MTATVTNISAWIYPGDTDVPAEYSDGRRLNMMKPQYFGCDGSGNLQLDCSDSTSYSGYTCVNSGTDGYSPANAAAVKRYSLQQFITISGAAGDLTALAGSSSLRTTFNTTCVNLLNTTGFTGIEFDLEAPWPTSGAGPTNFNNLKTLCVSTATALHNAGYKLMVSGPGIGVALESSYQFSYAALEALSPPPDFYSPQVYDHFYDVSGIGGAGAPLSWITDVCNMFIAQVSNLNKVVMGIGNHGWHGTSGSYSATYEDYVQSQAKPGFSTATRDSGSGEMMWTNAGISYDYSDSTTLNGKLSTILASGLTQVGVWHLGGHGQWFTTQYNPPLSTPALSGTVVKQDTFANRSVGPSLSLGTASGGGSWNTLAAGGMTATTLGVVQQEGIAYYDNSGLSNGYAETVISGAAGVDVEVLCRFGDLSLTGTGHFGLFTRYTVNSQWYRCNINTGDNWVTIEKMVGGSYTASTTYYSVTMTAGTYYWCRFKTAGSTQQVKIWADGTTEPGGWTGTQTDSTVTATGQVGMMLVPISTSSAGGLSFDSFSAVTVGSTSTSSPYQTQVLGNGPVAYYRLGEASGTSATDASGNGLTAAITGSGVTYGQTGAITGDTDTAMLFDGSTGDILCPSGLNPAGWKAFTVEAWVRLSNVAFSGNARVSANSHTDTDHKGYQLFIGSGGASINFAIGNGTTYGQATGSFAFAANTWYHVAGTYNGTTATVYINGVSRATATISGTIASSGFQCGLAFPSAYTAASDYLPGMLDEVAFYHATLTAATLLNDYALGSGNSTSYIYLVNTGDPIQHQDINQAAYIEQQQSGALEKGKYELSGNAYVSGGYLSIYLRTLSQTSVPVSVSIDAADTAASGMATPTALNLTAFGFRVHSTSTGITTNAFAAGNYTVTY